MTSRIPMITGAVALLATAALTAQAANSGAPERRTLSPAQVSQWEAARSTPVQDPIYPAHGFAETDVLHYHLGLNWDGRTLQGVTTATVRAAQATQQLRFNLHTALSVSNVTVGGASATFTHRNHRLTINTGSLPANTVQQVVITYGGQPRGVRMPASRGWTLGWQAVQGGVATLQEPYGAYTWYPSNDHVSDKAYYDATITTTNGQMGVFNGVLKDKQVNGNTTVAQWHLDSPSTPYAITIAIGEYQVLESTMSDGKPNYIWYTNADRRYIREAQAEFKRAYDWLVSKAGPYPYSSSGMVVTVGTGAMETQQMITMSRSWLSRNPRTSVIQHELGHQWYGNAVSPTQWTDMWLNEGWTTYMERLYTGGFNPRSAERACANSLRHAGPASNPKPNAFAEPNVYQCPMPALDQVRRDVGDDTFFGQVASGWPAQHLHRNVDRATFLRWLQQTTGRSYDQLFSRWIDRAQKMGRTTGAHSRGVEPPRP